MLFHGHFALICDAFWRHFAWFCAPVCQPDVDIWMVIRATQNAWFSSLFEAFFVREKYRYQWRLLDFLKNKGKTWSQKRFIVGPLVHGYRVFVLLFHATSKTNVKLDTICEWPEKWSKNNVSPRVDAFGGVRNGDRIGPRALCLFFCIVQLWGGPIREISGSSSTFFPRSSYGSRTQTHFPSMVFAKWLYGFCLPPFVVHKMRVTNWEHQAGRLLHLMPWRIFRPMRTSLLIFIPTVWAFRKMISEISGFH